MCNSFLKSVYRLLFFFTKIVTHSCLIFGGNKVVSTRLKYCEPSKTMSFFLNNMLHYEFYDLVRIVIMLRSNNKKILFHVSRFYGSQCLFEIIFLNVWFFLIKLQLLLNKYNMRYLRIF